MNRYLVLKEYDDPVHGKMPVGSFVMLEEKNALKLIKNGVIQLSADLTMVDVAFRYQGLNLELYNTRTGNAMLRFNRFGILDAIAANLIGNVTGNITGVVTGQAGSSLEGDVKGKVEGTAGSSLIGTVTGSASQLKEGTATNAVAASVELAKAVVDLISDGDTVEFEGSTFTKVAGAPGDNQFSNAGELAGLFEALEAWAGVEAAGKVTVTAATKGVIGNNKTATVNILAGTTAGGGASAKSTVTIAAADIAQFANGDTVSFDGSTFTKADVTDAATGAFADTAGLKDCIDGMDDWTAVVNGSDIDVTAAADGDNNGKTVDIDLKRTTSLGKDGTEGAKGDVLWDASNIYVCTATNSISGANWKKVAIAP